MLVNGSIAWNVSLDVSSSIPAKLNHSKWRVYVVNLLLNWLDPVDTTIILPIFDNVRVYHCPVPSDPLSLNWRQCHVCGLEITFVKILEF